MAEGRPSKRRGRRWRERVAAITMALFPLLVAGGFLAPGLVHVLAVAEPSEEGARGPVADRLGRYARRPLVVPRNFSSGATPELLDLGRLFGGNRVDPRSVVAVSAFRRGHGDNIVTDDAGGPDFGVVFRDALAEEQATLVAALDLESGMLPLCGTLHAGNCIRDDDFNNGGQVVDFEPIPEPASAALLLLGLAGLARRRRVRPGLRPR